MHGGGPLGGQEVALHRVNSTEAGEIATSNAAADGTFSFELPRVPGGSDEVYFVSTRHHGILYFGAAVTDVAALDSVHTLEVFDTVSAPPGGYEFTISARSVFVEEVAEGWQLTDVFELENTSDRTVIAGADGVTWSYPVMEGARDIELGDGDLGPDVFSFDSGRVKTSAPVPPGSRLYVFRYQTSELGTLALPGQTTRVEVLVREPAAPFAVGGLTAEQPVAIDPGSTFRRYTGDTLTDWTVSFAPGAEVERIPLEVVMVLLALCLGLLGVWGVTRNRRPQGPRTRAGVLLAIAQLDERFAAITEPTPAQLRRHRRRREALLRGLPEA